VQKLHTEYYNEVIQYQNEFSTFCKDFKLEKYSLKSKKSDSNDSPATPPSK
jgi:hypothetical protein